MTHRSPSSRSSRLSGLRQLTAREWPILVGLMAPAAAVWILLELADEVREGSTAVLDQALLLLFRNPANHADPLGPAWLQEMMRDFTALGGVGVLSLIALGACGYLLLVGKRRAALAVLVAIAGGVLISQLIKAGIDRPRPDLVPHGSYVSTASFPSGHSMMAATVYLTLAAMLARVQPRWRSRSYLIGCAIFIVVFVGVSRVYLGVHWPTDVLAGWSVGAGWAIGCWMATLWLQRRGTVEGEEEMPSESGFSRDNQGYCAGNGAGAGVTPSASPGSGTVRFAGTCSPATEPSVVPEPSPSSTGE